MQIEKLLNYVEDYNNLILLGLAALLLILLLISLVNALRLSKLKKNYKELSRGKDRVSLEDIVTEMGKEVDKLSNSTDLLKRDFQLIEEGLKSSIKNVGMVRYNAFDDLGSDQSFSLALLDSKGNGLILTSIYGRDYSSNYLKPIVAGEAKYKLSEEEERALTRAGLV